MLNRKKLVKKFINEGFSHRTLSLFSDGQLRELSKKVFKEAEDNEPEKVIQAKSVLNTYYKDKAEQYEDTKETQEVQNIETDDEGNPDLNIDGKPLLRELPKEVEEDFASKAQQKYLYAVNPAAAEKLASKMTKQDYEDLPEYVNESEILQKWIMRLVESNERPSITKANFIKTIKEYITPDIEGSPDSPFTLTTVPQQDSFDMVVGIGSEMTPPMEVKIDDFDNEGHLNGYLKSDESDKIIDLNICPAGDIKLDGNAVGSIELSETDRDDEGEYIGAPEDTQMPTIAPVKPATTPTTKPGRPGPFKRPKTTPKPKAKNKSTLPSWLSSTNLGKALTQHG